LTYKLQEHIFTVKGGQMMNINKKVLICLLLAIVLFIANGCASIFNGNSSMLNIMTNPENATVTIKGSQSGEKIVEHTPCNITLNKGSDYMVKINFAGYQSENIIITRGIAGWFWGNLLLGGVIGMVIDYSSNNMWQHTPTNINIDLTKLSSLPETIRLEYPVTLLMEDGTKVVKNLPITFHKNTTVDIL
jgi:hypothetical protein